MQKKIDMMSQILQQNNLGYRIPEGAKKKKPKDLNSKKDNSSHALIAINSSPMLGSLIQEHHITWLHQKQPILLWMHAEVLLF